MQKIKISAVSGLSDILVPVTSTTQGFMIASDKLKLDGLATGATANDTDENLKNRANHTGTQDISTIENLQTSLDGKANKDSGNNFTGVNRFGIAGQPAVEIWDSATHDGNAVRFGPQGGISFATAGVWESGSFANLKNALYNDRDGSIPSIAITTGAGVAAGVGGTFYPAVDGLHLALAGGRDIVFRSDNGNMGVPGNFFAEGDKPVWHSGNYNPAEYAKLATLVDFTRVSVSGNAGTGRQIRFNTGTSVRWTINTNGTAEGGSNAGSDFTIDRYTDAGAYIGNILIASRATGVVNFAQAPTVNGNPIGGGGSDPDAVKVSTTGLGMDTPQGLYAGVVDQVGLRALPTGYTGTVGVSSPAMPTTLSGSLFKIGTRGGTSATRGATYLHMPLASTGAAPRVWFGQAPNDSVDVAWTEVWTAGNFNPGSYGALGNSQTWTGSNVFSGAVPVRANGNLSGSGFVDLASINASSSAGIVFRGSDAGRWGYIDASSTTLRINADVGSISLNRRPTFNGNLAWDAGNLNPATFVTTSAANQFTAEQKFTGVPGSGGQIRLKTNTGVAEYGSIHRMDNSNYYILLTNSGDADGVWNGLRPFRIGLADGYIYMDNGATIGGGLTLPAGLNVSGGGFTYQGNGFSQSTSNNSFVQRDGAGWVYGTGMRTETGNGNGLRLWGGNAAFSLYMSSAADATWGGRAPGETTSDYNIYLRNGGGGTNRGFNFKIDNTVVAGIDAGGNFRTLGGVVAGDIYSGSWFRVNGNNHGIYWEQFGGGIHMSDVTWIRTYNGKNFYCNADLRGSSVITEDWLFLKADKSKYIRGGLGAIDCSHELWGPNFVATSDGRLKENIKTISNEKGMLDVMKLRPVTFDWKESGKSDLGFVAQEVREVHPELVREKEDGTLAMSYGNVTATLTAALQGALQRIADLEAIVNEMRERG